MRSTLLLILISNFDFTKAKNVCNLLPFERDKGPDEVFDVNEAIAEEECTKTESVKALEYGMIIGEVVLFKPNILKLF